MNKELEEYEIKFKKFIEKKIKRNEIIEFELVNIVKDFNRMIKNFEGKCFEIEQIEEYKNEIESIIIESGMKIKIDINEYNNCINKLEKNNNLTLIKKP